MTTISLQIPSSLQERYNFAPTMWLEEFTRTLYGADFVSPDLTFTPLSDLSAWEREKLRAAKTYDPSELINL